MEFVGWGSTAGGGFFPLGRMTAGRFLGDIGDVLQNLQNLGILVGECPFSEDGKDFDGSEEDTMKKRILVVDDSIFVYEEIRRGTANSDYEVIGWAKTGKQGLAMFESLEPDLVTMDIVLPDLDGMDVSKRLLLKHGDARIVVISSLAYDRTIQESITLGARGFVFKPFSKEDLLLAFDQAFES